MPCSRVEQTSPSGGKSLYGKDFRTPTVTGARTFVYLFLRLSASSTRYYGCWSCTYETWRAQSHNYSLSSGAASGSVKMTPVAMNRLRTFELCPKGGGGRMTNNSRPKRAKLRAKARRSNKSRTSLHLLGSLRPSVGVVVQLAALSAALYVILSAPHEDSTIKWAFGIVGMLLGQRLRG